MNRFDQVEVPSARAVAKAWVADLIAPDCDGGRGSQACYVTQSFEVSNLSSPVKLEVSALGLYRAFVNGRRVGNDQLTPGLTCYDDRIAFQSYDISPLLKDGENRIVIWLGDGWYRSPILWDTLQFDCCWGDRIGAIAEVHQGKQVILRTNETWRSGLLPIIKSEIYYGEDYDARLDKLESTAGVSVLAFDKKLLVPHETAPVRELEPLSAVRRWRDAEGRYLFDFGQNLAGYVRFSVSGSEGVRLRVEHAEVLDADGHFDNRNFRSARAEVHYTLKGQGTETHQPYFTFMGFRYARISIDGEAELRDVVSVPISSVPIVAGGLTTGNESVNRLVLNTIWSQRANFIEIPTDCPQRDERLGWTGDAQVFAGTAAWLADVHTFLRKYLRDVVHDQRPSGAIPHFSPDPTRLHQERFSGLWAGSTGWGDAITVIPWQLYLHYGDKSVLEECFPATLRWLDYLWNISGGPIIRPASAWGADGFTFGDWLQPTGSTVKPRPTIGDDCAATLYHYISTTLALKFAEILGEDREAERLRLRVEQIRSAFVREYYSPAGRLAHNDQTSYALAFLYDLVPHEHFEASKSYFRKIIEDAEFLIGTGFIGTPALLPALSKLGMHDLAEKVFLNRRAPGWLYQVELGATTIWERWDALGPHGEIYDPEMNSYNHYAYGAVCQWLFEDIAGIAPSAQGPGFDTVLLKPTIIAPLSPVSAWHDTHRGRLQASWTLSDHAVEYSVTLPDGSHGLLLPNARHTDVHVDGQAVEVGPDGHLLASGPHQIRFSVS